MAKTDLKVATIKTGNSVSTIVRKLTQINNKIIYGKSQVPPIINFSDPRERNQFTSNIKSFTQDPSLVNAVFVLQNLNSFDLCNPFMFAISQTFPPGSEVANVYSRVQDRINSIVSAFENFSIVDGVKQAEANPRDSLLNESQNIPSIPFATGKLFFNIKTTDVLSNGAYVTITQLQDNKINTSMVGQISQVSPASFAGAQNIEVNINNVFPPDPSTLEDGETLRTFSRFNIEYETKTSTDIRQLSEDLQGLTAELRSIGILDIAQELDQLPDFIPGVNQLKTSILDITSFIEDVGPEAVNVADVTGTGADVLAGNIPTSEVLLRVRKLRDFYNKIRPYTNLNFAIQSFFEDEIEGINRFLRDTIPYDAIAKIVSFIATLARTVLGVINYIIGILKIISTAIKVVTITLKVLRIVIKVLKIAIKAIPSTFVTIGVHEKAINGVAAVEEAIQQIIDILQLIQWGVDSTLRQLQLTKFYLEQLIREGAKLQATLESCPGLNNSNLDTIINQANRNTFTALNSLLTTVPSLNSDTRFGNNGTGPNNNTTTGTTFVITEGGSILVLTDTVFGFDQFGNIVFYGDLTSLSTGVNFENTLGQDFRSRLQYYTFNKFKNLDSAGNLIQKAEKLFLQQQDRIADPEDVFGNFRELYLGYTLKIQEEKRTDENSQILVRRRGIALDSNEKLVASTELTFSTNLASIVQELKIKLNQFVQQGIIGINTFDSQPNEVSDEDAINLAESYGANPIGINNLKANNADNSITQVSNGTDASLTQSPTPSSDSNQTVETRIGNEPFSSPDTNNINTTVQGIPVNTSNNNEMQVTGNSSSTVNRKIDLQKLTSTPLNDFITQNPSLKKIQDTFSTISKISPKELSAILSQPGADKLSEEELITRLKVQILSELDPNPEKVDEIKILTDEFLSALEGVVRAEWEAATRNIPFKYRTPFEVYYKRVEDDKIQEFIQVLLRKGYTEAEIQLGLSNDQIGEKYRIKIEGTKVTVKLRATK